MFIKINGINMFYQTCGQGRPIILLHGNGENHDIFDELIPLLAEKYKVYALDSRGHGQSSQVKAISYSDMCEDLHQFILALNINRPLVYGFSDGGITGLLLAIKHPDLLSGLIVSGANTSPDGLKSSARLFMRIAYLFKKSILTKLMLTEPNIGDAELALITVPTVFIAGQRDVIKEEHTQRMAQLVANSKVLILQGETHESYVVHSDKLYDIISSYIEYEKQPLI